MIRFLLKGLLRDRSRSLLPFVTVILGSMLTVVGFSWLNGAISTIVESGANFSAGHVKVMTRAYAKEADLAPNDLALEGAGALLAELRRDHPDLVWTPRIKFGGLVDIPDEKGETRAGEILLSDGLATRLGVGPGSTATLIGATMYGAMAVQNFTVSGTLHFGIAAMDRGAIVADIADIQAALDMEDAAGEVLGFERDSLYRKKEATAVAAAFNAAHAEDEGDFAPVMVTLHDQGGFAQTLDFATSIYSLMLVLFILVMSIVLWNAGLMSSLRRYGEFGIRLALGEDHGRLYRTLIAEGAIVGLLGSSVGTALGLAVAYYLQTKGLNIGGMLRNASMLITDVLRARVTPASYVIGFVPGLAATFLGKAVSGLGVYKRQTSQLAKEFEA
jgi:putative ABC transport system permease protein